MSLCMLLTVILFFLTTIGYEVLHNDEEIFELCQKLVDGMPKRIHAFVEAKGGNTKY